MQKELVQHAKKRNLQQARLFRRLSIKSLIQSGVHVGVCAWFLGCSVATVHRWLQQIESSEQLLDKPRASGRPLYDEATQLRAVGFYCQGSLPGCNRWSLKDATEHLRKNPEIIGAAISRSTLHRFLQMHSLRPHMVRYFLQISDPDFFPKMEHLIRLYLSWPRYLFCLDECPGIQALERIGKLIKDNDGVRLESEYIRHGRKDFIGILEVATGKVFGRCTDDHLQGTIDKILREHVSMQPGGEKLHYILDNLAGHSTELLCRSVAELSGVSYPKLKYAEERRAWLQSEDKRIIFHFTPFHGSWLNMIEIWFSILHKKCLNGRSFASVQALEETIHSFLKTWNSHFAHPFTWTYTGDGLAEKVVRRLCEWLAIDSEMKLEKMYTELQLMTNIAKDYWCKVPEKRWQFLGALLDDKADHINRIVAGHPEAEASFAGLRSFLSTKLRGTASGIVLAA